MAQKLLTFDKFTLLYDLDPGKDSLPYVTAPASCPFDPYEAGEYSFALVASTTGGAELGRAGINVDVVPEPASLALLGLGLAGLGASRRRKS